jgi:arylsulfatase A-like enzyme
MTESTTDSTPDGEDNRPNILFIMSDDHSERAISAYGSTLINTPNIDRLADEGMIFRESFVANSICGPSRAIMLTGKHSHKNGFRGNDDQFDGSQPTFPLYLQQAGYATAVVGKWHLGTQPVGFDYWEVLGGQGHYYSPEFITNIAGDITTRHDENYRSGAELPGKQRLLKALPPDLQPQGATPQLDAGRRRVGRDRHVPLGGARQFL